jgi:tRNA-dihydrouridine synthase B
MNAQLPVSLPSPISPGQPLTALAPMQDVTDLPFMRLIGSYGPPDFFFTEYFRVHSQSVPEKHIVRSILEHGTGRPVFAQLIGEDLEHIERTVELLSSLPIAGIDLNLGCPAPKVYKKNVGGGLLRDLEQVDRIFGLLRAISPHRFTVKCRLGFDSRDPFPRLLELVNKHRVDLLSVHGRTVREMYRAEVRYDYIRLAVETVACPVLANGNITSAAKAHQVLKETGARGVMIGRAAIRNPWIFRQIRESYSRPDAQPFAPTFAHLRHYIDDLWETTHAPHLTETSHVARMKKFLNFVGQGVDAEGRFLKQMRHAHSHHELMTIADQHLLKNGAANRIFPDEPFPGVLARPNHEGSTAKQGCHL